MMKQTERVLDYIKTHGSITAVEALTDIGVYRLASRIADLKQAGYKISSTMVGSKNRYGETVHFKRYTLVGGN